ncbi:MAG TPA: cob(I)yrinic acid a,c-diamide adenosyltransferase [Candidatus Woesearchaeota archaeon]|jgi:cob(I)alamin adenosyltransferase|nr:cob(I)yrinic acid a,c-diamide adenosyltransferase [Candidatus Woesearchaeota archaeon]|tara:strand:+ start:16198 stop:16812 length:615 start_codon:yes stop_codon:yes gene_type:complete
MVTKIKKKIIVEGDEDKTHLGLVHVITGEGQGKTTGAIGLAVRAFGSNLRVYIIQFLKSGPSGEKFTLRTHLPTLPIMQFGVDAVKERQQKLDLFTDKGSKFVFNPDEEEREAAQLGFKHAKKIINSNDYDMVILDELNTVMDKGIIDVKDVLDLMNNHGKVELVFTGRDAPQEVIEKADYVSKIERIKHPWMKGIKARKGIEY